MLCLLPRLVVVVVPSALLLWAGAVFPPSFFGWWCFPPPLVWCSLSIEEREARTMLQYGGAYNTTSKEEEGRSITTQKEGERTDNKCKRVRVRLLS